ncbi:hypothetical protein P3G55_01890 [Leptospira sp. 96542]|nr:hypothetical protein [Leptospira sp. 96542]
MNLFKLTFKYWKKTFHICIVLLFSVNFTFQKIVDNEANCGGLGNAEAKCPYAFLDHAHGLSNHELSENGDHDDHVCISCPCNLIVSCSWDLYLSHIRINLHKVYLTQNKVSFPKFSLSFDFFRPPRLT